ncbi:hypothetical protein SETIT_7G240700v2 [Setaria italica]|uniref:Uncharacterized protein n=1 Tax=Setaria italica TaxID=4555 RepID=K3YAL7_SETIT|nr:uncharacterized protein LOC101763596 [Setaria italica]RCV35448.1 hypothetical protein SETIT_7G240700v2 [Setaria italica]RCV35449.1 hypothetical protein SETIT_7G240700v2 [Setaria italica]
MASKRLLVALCVVALLAVRSESHGLEDFNGGSSTATPAMQTFFKPEAAALPEALDASMPATMAAKPEASAIPTTTTTTTTATATATPTSTASASPRRSVSVAAGVACGIAAVAVVGIAAAVAYVVRGRRGARRGTEVQLGSSAL